MIRALEEMEVEGVATTIPADLAILRHPDFIAAAHSTKWVEERLDLTGVVGADRGAAPADGEATRRRSSRDVDVEVNGKRFAVKVWVPESAAAASPRPASRRAGSHGAAPRQRPRRGVGGSGQVTVPMQGTIVKVLVEVGDAVEAGEAVCVLEAMKMENQITAEQVGHREGDQGRRGRHRRCRRRRRRHQLTQRLA